jgi:hypothetical protein
MSEIKNQTDAQACDEDQLNGVTGGTGETSVKAWDGKQGYAYQDPSGRIRVRLDNGHEMDFEPRPAQFMKNKAK